MTCKKSFSIISALCCVGLMLLLSVGCSDSQRIAIEGTVDLDGQPMDEGTIAFQPLPGTASPSTGGKIKDGQFSIPVKDGGFAGKFRVAIAKYETVTAKPQPGRVVGGGAERNMNILPKRYNTSSELTAEVTPDGDNTLHFDVTSK